MPERVLDIWMGFVTILFWIWRFQPNHSTCCSNRWANRSGCFGFLVRLFHLQQPRHHSKQQSSAIFPLLAPTPHPSSKHFGRLFRALDDNFVFWRCFICICHVFGGGGRARENSSSLLGILCGWNGNAGTWGRICRLTFQTVDPCAHPSRLLPLPFSYDQSFSWRNSPAARFLTPPPNSFSCKLFESKSHVWRFRRTHVIHVFRLFVPTCGRCILSC